MANSTLPQSLGISLSLALLPTTTLAQVTFDGTVGTAGNCAFPCTVLETDGTQRGSILFHSFQQFSIPAGLGNTVTFNAGATIENIVARVTGGSLTSIDNFLRVNSPNVNLFLINPNGISFGTNARLDIPGSFIASTASAIRFPDGSIFSATNPGVAPTLTNNLPPNGLIFNGNPGSIVNQARSGMTGYTNSLGQSPGLGGSIDNTIALIGGNVSMNSGNVTAGNPVIGGGRIEIGSVLGSGTVQLNPVSDGFTADYSGIQTPNTDGRRFGDIQLLNGSILDASGFTAGRGGDIQVYGDRLTVRDSAITSTTFNAAGGSLNITANSIELSGRLADVDLPAAFATQTRNSSSAGNITLNASQLTLNNGALISTDTISSGAAGAIAINAASNIQLSNDSLISSSALGGSTGNAGNVALNTAQLAIDSGSQIFASTGGAGNAGTVKLSASESIAISGEGNFVSGIFSQVNPPATGSAGNINLSTANLAIANGGQISASTLTSGNGGTVNISANTIQLSGRGSQAPSGIFAVTEGSGSGGSINISSQPLDIFDGARISVQGTATGDAGNININASHIFLNNDSTINAETANGQGGNINLTTSSLILLRNRSRITTTAGTADAPGDGGNITINSPLLVGLENSDITSNSFRGRGGLIDITAQGIFGLKVRSQLTPLNDITAFSLFDPRLNGQIVINTPDIDPTQGLTEAIEQQNPDLIATGCDADTSPRSATGSFINTGRGDIRPNPGEALGSTSTWDDRRPFEQDADSSSRRTIPAPAAAEASEPIVEAQGWVRIDADTVKLIVNPVMPAPTRPLPRPGC